MALTFDSRHWQEGKPLLGPLPGLSYMSSISFGDTMVPNIE